MLSKICFYYWGYKWTFTIARVAKDFKLNIRLNCHLSTPLCTSSHFCLFGSGNHLSAQHQQPSISPAGVYNVYSIVAFVMCLCYSSADPEHSVGEGNGSGCQSQSGRAKPGHEAPTRNREGATGGKIRWTRESEGEIQTALCRER